MFLNRPLQQRLFLLNKALWYAMGVFLAYYSFIGLYMVSDEFMYFCFSAVSLTSTID